MIQKENDGKDMKFVLPFFISTTDDTTMFTFEGEMNGKCEFIIKKNENHTRSAYTKYSSSPLMRLVRSQQYMKESMAWAKMNYHQPPVLLAYSPSLFLDYVLGGIKIIRMKQLGI